MQKVQRQFGRLMNKNPGDNAKVSILLNDYEEADRLLARIIDNIGSWRESWLLLLRSQLQAATEYEGLYDPIAGASDGHGCDMVVTPDLQLNRTLRLKEVYAELQTDLVDELGQIDERILRPATDARECIQPIRKTIKKRENKRQDYENCQARVSKLQQKARKVPKEEATLAKVEDEMATLADEFSIADTHLRETLPPIISAAFSLIPPLLNNHVLIQNRLLGLYYTTSNAYCTEVGFPSPPPSMDEVIAAWEAGFKPAQRDVEALGFITKGRAIQQPMSAGSDGPARSPANTAGDGFRRVSSGLIPGSNNAAGNATSQRPQRVPSASSIPSAQPSRPVQSDPSPGRPDHLAPTDFTTAVNLGRAQGIAPGSLGLRADSGGGSRPGQAASTAAASLSPNSNGRGPVKKRPPPPPPKRVASGRGEEFVVAQYDFGGEGQGDLSFRAGDRIKIVHKTDTDQDWWVGEVAGARGNFPANYCKPA